MKRSKLHYDRDKPILFHLLYLLYLNCQNLTKKFPTFPCINCSICFRNNMKRVRLKNYDKAAVICIGKNCLQY